MLDRLRHVRLSAVALALYALATLVVGFAHKPLAPAMAGDLAALALQADAPLSLCDHDGGAPAQPHHAALHVCDACALASAPGLPPANLHALPAPPTRSVASGFGAVAQFAPAPLHAPLSRGPPAA
ncbi:MAG TPA: hypothetical protein PKA55_13530 [Rhodoblastus sp.]|nr:hypothetical protein [Rhodoblastus sp.]